MNGFPGVIRPVSETLPSGFPTWLQHARRGDACEYHRGFLAVDRDALQSKLSPEAQRVIVANADMALATAEAGHVVLVQRRLGDGVFGYLAIRAVGDRRPAMPMVRRAGR